MIGPKKPGDPVIGLLVGFLGLLTLWFVWHIMKLSDPDDAAITPVFALVGLAFLGLVAWISVKGFTRRRAITLTEKAIVLRHVRQQHPDSVIPWADIMALHHGSLGDKAQAIRIEVRLPDALPRGPGHTDRPALKTRVIFVGANQFRIGDLEVMEVLRQAWTAAGYDWEQKSGVPVFGRTSWVAKSQSSVTVT